MRKNYTHLIILLDKSGSMEFLKNDTIGGVNRLVAEQKALPGNFTASLYQFNNTVQEVESVTVLTPENYQPFGSTALIDALCRVIDREGEELRSIQEAHRPDKVVVLIVTDGEENASTHFKKADVQSRVMTQSTVYKWEFVFMGANIDAFAEASDYSIKPQSTYQFMMTPTSIQASYASASDALTNYRSGKATSMELTPETK